MRFRLTDFTVLGGATVLLFLWAITIRAIVRGDGALWMIVVGAVPTFLWVCYVTKAIQEQGRHRRQTTFVYCPTCGLEQIANGCFVSDTDLVRYQCKQCGTRTEWLFDAPAPILISANGVPSRYLQAEALS
jgi:predicted RNA-binding Zn-ribbon protein involved in translation (DUF1610 family)